MEAFEVISIFLAISTAVAGTLAFVYKRGMIAGIDKACGHRIEKKIDEMKTEGDKIHNEIKIEMRTLATKIDNLKGSFETFKQLIK